MRGAKQRVVKVVGLTGGIGSGKSTVADMLRALGATVIDADLLAREAVEPGTPGLAEIVEHFGPQILTSEGTLDRPALGRTVFGNEDARKTLNQIVHPRVAALAQARIEAALAQGAELVIYDVPLLYESRLDQALPEVIVVSVSPETQRARVAARDDLTPAEIEARMASQMPLADKVARADHVIDNEGGLERTRVQVTALFDRLTQQDTP